MKTAFAAAVAALLAGPAFADDDHGFYLAADAGVTRADTRKGDFDQVVVDSFAAGGVAVLSGESSLDDRDSTYGITVGYRASPNFAFEAGYVDLGDIKYRADGELTDGVVIVPASLDVTIESAGLALSALVIWPQDALELYARLGAYYADNDARVSVAAEGVTLSESDSKSSEEFFWGVGGSYSFSDRWALRLEFREYSKVGDNDLIGEADVSTLKLGATYAF